MNLSEDEWKAKLTPDQYKILREKGTETPFSGNLLNESRAGSFSCAACGELLFSSEHKFESRDGWPSFYDVAKSGAVKLADDTSYGMRRIEVLCANCGSHLGHIFDDGPGNKGGKHYCINSVCLDFNLKD